MGISLIVRNQKMSKSKIQIVFKKTGDLIPYARNSRTHDENQVAQIAGSIKEFGFTNPILVDNENGIIAGHGRVMAAQKLKMKEVPCIVLGHLTEAQRRAYIIADNKLALNAGWDEELLALELSDLREMDFDLNLTGFDGEAIEAILNPDEPNFEPGTEDDQGRLDELSPKIVDCPYCKKSFDLREHGQG